MSASVKPVVRPRRGCRRPARTRPGWPSRLEVGEVDRHLDPGRGLGGGSAATGMPATASPRAATTDGRHQLLHASGSAVMAAQVAAPMRPAAPNTPTRMAMAVADASARLPAVAR